MNSSNAPSLVVDIGGTNTRVALCAGNSVLADSIQRFRNAEFSNPNQILDAYLQQHAHSKLNGICIALAGPVQDNKGEITNLDWIVDPAEVRRQTGTDHVVVLNDLQAQGYALPYLPGTDLDTIIEGTTPENPHGANALVIGIGTGFNIASVIQTATGPIVNAAEAGHAALNVENEADLNLSRELRGEDKFAAIEDVLSGRGLGNVYAFVAKGKGQTRPADGTEVTQILQDTGRDDPIAEQAMHVFQRQMGIVAGNLALNFLPFGGIYLCGGMARAVAPFCQSHGFAQAFRSKGRFSDLMGKFPVRLINDDYAALTGCAARLNVD